MRICAYVVTDPATREDLKASLYEAMKREALATITLQALDDDEPSEDRTVEFVPLQASYDGFGQHFFSGYLYEASATSEGDMQRYIINVTIPPWDRVDSTAKIRNYPIQPNNEME